MNALAVLGLIWLLGTGILVPVLIGRRGEKQDKLPTRFEHLRATSTYSTYVGQGVQRAARPQIVFRAP
jgi:hypothetical protein